MIGQSKNKIYIAACYERLSVDDSLYGTSESIETQIKILEDFCRDHQIVISDHYYDDGYTGTNFNRPQFIKMINDYYISGEIEPLLYKAKMWKKGDTERQNYPKQKLEDILKYYGGIQKFVRSVYGINDEAFVKYLVYKPEERDEEAIIDMIESFWDHRMKEINKKRKSIGMV